MAKLKGICKNIDGCDLASDKVEQEAEKSNFVCSECGKPLTQVKTGGGDGPNKMPIIIIIAALILIGGGAGAWFGGLFDGSSEPEPQATDSTSIVDTKEAEPIDTIFAAVDSAKVATDSAKVATDSAKVVTDSVKPEPKPVGPKFSWGKYTGPASGFGGELKVTRQHTIDLGNTRGEVIDVYPGDVIKNTKITNGKLVQGILIRTDGTQKTFTIGV